MALIFVFSRKKVIRITIKAGVIYTPLHDSNSLLRVFFLDGTDLKFDIGHKGEKYSLRNTSRMLNLEFVG